jgi:ubiquinone/menaquinone biosynthesis C-methylase UbiE
MAKIHIRYDDGVAYERMMGTWSRAAGEIFLDWLAPSQGLSWINVGCGTGSFAQLLTERCAPVEVEGVDPSEAQLSFARAQHLGQTAKLQQGDAQALPFSDERFDAAVMALVIFFVPDLARGINNACRNERDGFHCTVATPFRYYRPGGIAAVVERRGTLSSRESRNHAQWQLTCGTCRVGGTRLSYGTPSVCRF